jgi:2-polyprenyl-3-methyl-5-hydroxy-6-metoxy-1,4-benzoquinol methylase
MLQWIRKISLRLFFRLQYFRTPPWDSGISPPELNAFLEDHPPGRALDLGCGTGTNVLTLCQHGWEVTGIDFVPNAIRQAHSKARDSGLNVNLITGDVSNSKLYQGHYDLILDIGCYHALNPGQRKNYRQNVASHLSPSGTYMLYGFTSEDGARISTEDVAAFEQALKLEKRVDSLDGSGPTSAWFWFKSRQDPSIR